jgi:hypothetical protein
MPKFGPGYVEFGPDDVESVEMTFHLSGIGFARFALTDDGGERTKFMRELYMKVVDTYGPGGENPLPIELQAVDEEAVR